MGRISLEELIKKVDEVPIFSKTVNRIINLAEDSRTDAKDIANEIMKDQGLTAKILKIANSAYYGSIRNIKTVSDATVLLGLQAIKSMVLANTVSGLMSVGLSGYALERGAMWKQSQICAITARIIANKTRCVKGDQAYIAGLLRDVGKLILDHYLRDDYKIIVDKVSKEQKSFVEIEEEILGFHHGQVGGKIAEKWNFPKDLVEAITYHHDPEKAVINPAMTATTHLADGIVMMLGLYLGVDGLKYELSTHSMQLLKINEGMLEEIMSEVTEISNDENTYITG